MLSRRTHDQPISIKLTFEFNLIAYIGERQSSACRNGLRASDAKSDGDTRLFLGAYVYWSVEDFASRGLEVHESQGVHSPSREGPFPIPDSGLRAYGCHLRLL